MELYNKEKKKAEVSMRKKGWKEKTKHSSEQIFPYGVQKKSSWNRRRRKQKKHMKQ